MMLEIEMAEIQSIKQRFKYHIPIGASEQALDTAYSAAPYGSHGISPVNPKEVFPGHHSLSPGNIIGRINQEVIPEGTINSELFGHEKGASPEQRVIGRLFRNGQWRHHLPG